MRHGDGQPVSIVQAHGRTIHIDRHEGTVLSGTGPDGKPYEVIQKGDYGFLPDVTGDDGEGYDVYLGNEPEVERVFIVTQVRADSGKYDEQKAMLGFRTKADAEGLYKAHTHPDMFGRIGALSLAAFRRQLDEHKESGAKVFRAETDEDAEEMADLTDYENGPASEPEPPSNPSPEST